jgi:hypothetical protein
VSNGDSGSDQEQDYAEIIVTDLGTNFFTVDLRGIELTGEQREAISSEILSVILARTVGSPSPADPMDRLELDRFERRRPHHHYYGKHK